jgi:hypothetical protein
MPRLSEVLSRQQRLALAVTTRTPTQVARTFARYEGQFYDRAAFDHLARETRAAYAATDAHAAAAFRDRLDQRLAERDRQPVSWDGAGCVAGKQRAG